MRCADLRSIRDGRNVEVAGVILVRQRPGSAKGVLFVTIEDETGVANGNLCPNRFELYRRQVMSASMVAIRGRLQKQGEVIHIICDRITDHDEMPIHWPGGFLRRTGTRRWRKPWRWA